MKAIEKYEKYGWKDHDGSEICPVDGNKRVKIKFRDGEVLDGLSEYFRWKHQGYDGDIVKYKVVKEDE